MTISKSSFLHYWSARNDSMAYVGGKPVHARSSAAKWIDQQGIVQSAIVNTPRSEWADLADGAGRRKVLRLEQARTNQLQFSEQFDNAYWTKAACSVSADQAIAPDGTLTADNLVEDGTTAIHRLTRDVAAIGNGVDYTLFCFARTGPVRTRIVLTAKHSDTTTEPYAQFNLATGVVQAGNAARKGIIALSGGWYLCWMSDNNTTGGSALNARIWIDDGSVGAYAGGSSNYVSIWGAQIELGKSPSSYIKTPSSAAVTRSADSFYWDFTPVPQAMYVYVRFIERGTVLGAGGSILFYLSDSSGNNPRFYVDNSGTYYEVSHQEAGGTVTIAQTVAPVYGDVVEIVAILGANGFVGIIQSINGGAAVQPANSAAQALSTAWSGTQFRLNSLVAASPGLADFAEVKIVKYADVVGATAADIMAELRAVELGPNGELL